MPESDILLTVSSLVLAGVIFGFFGRRAGAAYVLSLFIALFAAAASFLRLAETLVASQKPDARAEDAA